jgi:hypothetical protein
MDVMKTIGVSGTVRWQVNYNVWDVLLILKVGLLPRGKYPLKWELQSERLF